MLPPGTYNTLLRIINTYSPSQPLGPESRNAPGELRDSGPRGYEGDYATLHRCQSLKTQHVIRNQTR